MNLYTSYYAKCKSGNRRLAISQGVPSWYTGRSTNLLAPDWSLVMGLKNHTITKAEYTARYIAYLDSLGIDRVLGELQNDDIMLCWEAKGKFCHRHILAEWLRQYGHTVTEL